MRKTLSLLWLLVVILGSLGAQDYYFESYHLAMDAQLDNRYAVVEQIVADFSTERHGIYREIPIKFGKQRVKLQDLSSNVPIVEDSVSSDYATFRLGSADRTVLGRQEYLISYTYAIGDDRNDEYDEFYYNLLGPGWQAPIQDFTFTLTFPKPIDPSMVFMTGGQYGSTAQRGVFSVSPDGKTITGEAHEIQSGEALTLRVQMEEGYFSEITPFVDLTLPFSLFALLMALLACVVATRVFLRYGRDELFVPVVRFEPPEDLSPLQVGYLADGVVDNKDLTSMLFYWADQGCLRIEEQSKKEFLFTKLQEPPTSKAHEIHLFDALFACGDGDSVTLKQLETGKFGLALANAKSEVHAYFKGERKLNDSKAERKRAISLLLAFGVAILVSLASTITYIAEEMVVLLVLGLFSAGLSALVSSRLVGTWEVSTTMRKAVKFCGLFVLLLLIAFVAFLFENPILEHGTGYSILMALVLVMVPAYLGALAMFTGKRSPYAQRKLEEIVGYKEFISKVEMDRLKMMIDQDPALFYHVLGYAIVLGLEDVWAKKFAKLEVLQPSWYVGNRPIRDVLFYSTLSHRLHASVMENSLYAEAKSGSRSPIHSSFGSSGFSGGGFGGGGGGAW